MTNTGVMSDKTVPIAHFRNLQSEFAKVLEQMERMQADSAAQQRRVEDYKRALSLCSPIVAAMCETFRPANWDEIIEADEACVEKGPRLSQIEKRHPLVLDTLRYGDLEIAAGAVGALMGVL